MFVLRYDDRKTTNFLFENETRKMYYVYLSRTRAKGAMTAVAKA